MAIGSWWWHRSNDIRSSPSPDGRTREEPEVGSFNRGPGQPGSSYARGGRTRRAAEVRCDEVGLNSRAD
jgi:hypothetical protein